MDFSGSETWKGEEHLASVELGAAASSIDFHWYAVEEHFA